MTNHLSLNQICLVEILIEVAFLYFQAFFQQKEIVISLTSFPGRIADVWIVIECLFRQTYKADKIILWVDKERFNVEDLPSRLKAQMKRGLEIRLVEDLRSHTKYYYALKEYNNSLLKQKVSYKGRIKMAEMLSPGVNECAPL